MKTTFVKNGAFRGRRLVLLETPVDPKLKDQLKSLPKADWNPEINPSTLPYSDLVIADLLRLLKGKGKKDGIIQINEKIIQKYPKPVSPCTLIGMPYETGLVNIKVSANYHDEQNINNIEHPSLSRFWVLVVYRKKARTTFCIYYWNNDLSRSHLERKK